MKNKFVKLIGVILVTTAMAMTMAGCGNTEDKAQATDTTQEAAPEVETEPAVTENADAKISGSITMAGSTSMEKIANAAAESFMIVNPDVAVNAEFTGSSAGIESLLAGSVQIGNASRALKESEIEAGAVENIIAIDGIAVVTDKANTVTGLSKEELIGIYTGTIKKWSEVGGNDSPIVVVGREAGSGTRGAFEEILAVEDGCAYANELDSTGAVMAKVASTPGAIGYVSLDVVDDSVIALALDEVEPTAENIKGGSYFLSRPFVMATKGEIAEQDQAVQAFFTYLSSEEGKALIQSVGLITVE